MKILSFEPLDLKFTNYRLYVPVQIKHNKEAIPLIYAPTNYIE